jgi:hypothetical protein
MSWHQLETARLLLELGHFVMEIYDRYVSYKESKNQPDEDDEEPEVRYVTFLPVKGQDEPEPDEDTEGQGASWLALY